MAYISHIKHKTLLFTSLSGLSVEAVTAHTAGTGSDGAKAAPSTVSNRNKASTISDQKSKADKSMVGSRTVAASSGEAGSQVIED